MTKQTERRDIYQVVTDRIVAALEEGTVPWRQPWSAPADAHRNPVSGTTYRGINPFLLELTAMGAGYSDPRWVTFKQAQSLGGSVRRGERSTLVVFWKQLRVGEKDETGAEGSSRVIPMLRHFNVFNVAQCDGLELEPIAQPVDFEPIAAAAALVDGMPNRPSIGHGGASAFYMPAMDCVQLPAPELFEQRERYYATAFHELVHSTGHASRLNRPEVADRGAHAFGSVEYSREELVAELGAAMLCGVAGIVPPVVDQAAAYIASWLRALKDDRKLLVSAAGRAQKAADYIRGLEAPSYA